MYSVTFTSSCVQHNDNAKSTGVDEDDISAHHITDDDMRHRCLSYLRTIACHEESAQTSRISVYNLRPLTRMTIYSECIISIKTYSLTFWKAASLISE